MGPVTHRHVLPLLALLLWSPAPVAARPVHPAPQDRQDDDEREARRKQVEQALERLEAAFGKKDSKPAERIGALQSVADVEDEKVVRAVARALEDADGDVVATACDVLGNLRVEQALESLHAYAEDHAKLLARDEELAVGLYRAIGRHGSTDSIELLTDKVFNVANNKIVEARLFALGRIRSPETLDALFDLMRKTDARKVQGHMHNFRFPLMVLSGVDHDLDPEAWWKWWKANRKGFRMAEQEPRLPDPIRGRWESFWGVERTYERNTRRGDRGQGGG